MCVRGDFIRTPCAHNDCCFSGKCGGVRGTLPAADKAECVCEQFVGGGDGRASGTRASFHYPNLDGGARCALCGCCCKGLVRRPWSERVQSGAYGTCVPVRQLWLCNGCKLVELGERRKQMG